MNSTRALVLLRKSRLEAVTTAEAAALWGSSPKAAAEMLRRFEAADAVRRVRRGLWVLGDVDPLALADRIAEPDAAYVSGLSALRLRGVIEQLPADVHLATTGRARRIRTPLGQFALRHIQPRLFGGFERTRGFPLATAEKAVFDLLYWSAARGRSARALPELSLPRGFRPREIDRWVRRIPSVKLRIAVERRRRELRA